MFEEPHLVQKFAAVSPQSAFCRWCAPWRGCWRFGRPLLGRRRWAALFPRPAERRQVHMSPVLIKQIKWILALQYEALCNPQSSSIFSTVPCRKLIAATVRDTLSLFSRPPTNTRKSPRTTAACRHVAVGLSANERSAIWRAEKSANRKASNRAVEGLWRPPNSTRFPSQASQLAYSLKTEKWINLRWKNQGCRSGSRIICSGSVKNETADKLKFYLEF